MNNYAKDLITVLSECMRAMSEIQKCIAYDGTKCAPNDSDLLMIAMAKDSLIQYCQLRNIDLKPNNVFGEFSDEQK